MKYKMSLKPKVDLKKKRMRNASFIEKFDEHYNSIKFMQFVISMKITVMYFFTTFLCIDDHDLEYDVYIVTCLYRGIEKREFLYIYSFGHSSIFFTQLKKSVTNIIRSFGTMNHVDN